jgi:hypothetical protein
MKSTSKHERQLAQQRDWFERILKAARCPKDGARVLEITMPNVVCSQCSTRYVLAMQGGRFLARWKLVEIPVSG